MGDGEPEASSDPIFEGEMTVRRRKPWPLAFAALLVGAALSFAIAAGETSHFVLLPVALLTLLTWLDGRYLVAGKARVRVDRDGITVNRRQIAARDIVSGHLAPGPDGSARVRLKTKYDSHCFDGDASQVVGAKILRAYGLDARRVDFRGMPWPVSSRVGLTMCVVAFVAVVFGLYWATRWTTDQNFQWLFQHPGRRVEDAPWDALHSLLGTLTTVSGLVVVVAMRALNYRFSVGADGIEVSALARGRRFIPYSKIATAASSQAGVRVTMRDATWVDLPLTGFWTTNAASTDAVALPARIQENLGAKSASQTEDAIASAYSDEPGRWLEALREVGQQKDSYRSREVTVERLAQLLADPAKSARDRAAAAYLLKLRMPEQTREHVRVACAASVDGDLRTALEEIADGELGGAENALRRLARRDG